MKRVFRLAMACVAMLTATTGQVQAGVITASFTTTLNLVSGGDAGGLNGATLNIYAEFDDAGVFLDRFSFPAINALTHTITISGASNGGSNGVYSDPSGLTYFPTFKNGFFDSSGLSLDAGPMATIRMDTFPGAVVPSIGDTISVNNFHTTSFDPAILMQGVDFSSYSWTAGASLVITGSSAAVPEPSSIALFGIGSCVAGIVAARRRRREKQHKATA